MPDNVNLFIDSRLNPLAITEKRIRAILWYVTECYLILKGDKPIYNKDWCNRNTAYKFEDYLKMEFVDSYLIKYKYLLKNRISELEYINFNYETIKRFADKDGIERSDKIDIYINKLGIQKQWNEPSEHVYFAIECKRIEELSSSKEYIKDIQNFCERSYKDLRLPFEGMIAFIENSKLTHSKLANHISDLLKNEKNILTSRYLEKELLNSSFDAGYSSDHSRNSIKKIKFTTFHLLFDYSDNIS
jgi:hypothetical protein